MREVEWNDRGFLYRVLIPDDAPDSNAQYGIVIGPPDLDKLDLPRDIHMRLHNELYNRRILTKTQARRFTPEVSAAVQAALRMDVHRVIECYE